jgi:catechol-2,3-dioxygenase
MRVKHLDHFNIIGPRELIEKVNDFYLRVFDFTEGPRPDFGIEGAWLYVDEHPLVHLTVDENAGAVGGGCIHHVALACEGLDIFMVRLRQEKIHFHVETIPQLSMTQLFLQDPAGIGIELNFREELQD